MQIFRKFIVSYTGITLIDKYRIELPRSNTIHRETVYWPVRRHDAGSEGLCEGA